MKNERAERANIIKSFSWKRILIYTLCCLLFLGLTLLNLQELMKLGKEDVYRNCQISYLLVSRELDGYLLLADSAVESASRSLEEMRRGGATDAEILAYMESETGNLDERIAGPTTGVYGYVGGAYLDGTGWTPPEGYEPTDRPWYLEAVKAGGRLTHVPPFDNMQTGSTTITICKLLSDGVSVVAMDIPTDHLQRAVEHLADSDEAMTARVGSPYSYAEIFVMDPGGVVIAHSDASQLRKNYAQSHELVAGEIARQVLTNGSTFFEIERGGETLVYSGGRLEGGWYVYAALKYHEVTQQNMRNLYISLAAAALGIVVMIAVMIRMFILRQRTAEAENYAELMRVRQETAEAQTAYENARNASQTYSSIAHTLSTGYVRLYYVDLETGGYIAYKSDDEDGEASETQGEDFFAERKPHILQRAHPNDRDAVDKALTRATVLQAMEEHITLRLTYRRQHADGEYAYANLQVRRIQDDVRHVMIGIGENEDVDARSELTGLRMETAFYVRGKELLQSHAGNWCVLALDIEHFKLFNEWYGREAGDRLLARIGERLAAVEKATGGLACYLGQDDFAALIPHDEERIKKLFRSIHDLVVEHGTSVGFMPAVGVCMADSGVSVEELFDRAAQAAQHAKEDYHHRIRVFEESMYQKTEQDYQILSDFQQALQNDELFIQLQPQCHIDTGKVVGAESLVRWRKADGKMISPGVFIPVLEQYGFVTDLDQFVWEQVCAWQKQWIDAGHTPLPVSVNVSQIDIFTIDVPAYFELLLWKYKLPVEVVKIEITESAYVGDGAVADTVRRLREKGFLVLMDDFGSGYSSLNMLRSLSVDIIKLDAQFLRMNGDDRKGVQILASIVGMAKSMESPIIVEGVETEEETTFIKTLGCRYVQGYRFYRPMPVADFEALIGDEDNIDTEGFVL